MGDMERRAYMDLQKWLDKVLGEDEDDGTGYGLVSDVMYAVEVVKRRAVNEALTEAADEIEGWRDMSHRRADDRSKDDHDRSKAIQRGNAYDRAARIVRARTT